MNEWLRWNLQSDQRRPLCDTPFLAELYLRGFGNSKNALWFHSWASWWRLFSFEMFPARRRMCRRKSNLLGLPLGLCSEGEQIARFLLSRTGTTSIRTHRLLYQCWSQSSATQFLLMLKNLKKIWNDTFLNGYGTYHSMSPGKRKTATSDVSNDEKRLTWLFDKRFRPAMCSMKGPGVWTVMCRSRSYPLNCSVAPNNESINEPRRPSRVQ